MKAIPEQGLSEMRTDESRSSRQQNTFGISLQDWVAGRPPSRLLMRIVIKYCSRSELALHLTSAKSTANHHGIR